MEPKLKQKGFEPRTKGQRGQIPFALGYRMPAEWERHEATWLSWPHDRETWPNELSELESTYVEIIEYLHSGEKIHILVQDEKNGELVSQMLAQRGISKNIFIHQVKTDNPWMRDYGPIFIVKKGNLAVTDWIFNAWGEKYAPYDQDNRVPEGISALIRAKRFRTDMVLEGGAIDVNGFGTCLAAEECLLNPNRNRGLGHREIEGYLRDFLGIRNVIWLKGGIAGDDTDGHVDEAARFVDPKTIVAAVEENSQDTNYAVLKRNWEILSRARDQDGNKLKIIPLPTPGKVERQAMRFPASYLNFYIGNRCVLIPVFGDRNDTKALGILKSLFPERTVVGIPAFPLIYGQGAIHCITQQEPAHG